MYLIERQLTDFSAAHRLINGYVGKCQHLHGHNYVVTVTLAAPQLDHYGFVADFTAVKKCFDNWVQSHWDHSTLVIEQDVALLQFLRQEGMKHYVVTGYSNTTAEVLAEVLYRIFSQKLHEFTQPVKLVMVKVAETSACAASYSPIRISDELSHM